MDGRKLKTLLKILQAHGVTSYEDKDLKLTLRPPESAPMVLDVSSEVKDLDEEEMRKLEAWSSAPT